MLAIFASTIATISPGANGDEPEGEALESEKVAPLALFEQRIMPIFKSEKPSSCVQCHLSAVDLRDYILPSHEQTFVSLRDNGLIDIENPLESKILNLINMGELDPDSKARRIHEKLREAEYEAFAAWIVACCSDEAIRELPAKDAPEKSSIGPKVPDSVIAFTRKSRLIDSFTRNVWSQRMRCFPCHTPNELDSNNPQHKKPIQRHADFVEKYGQRMNIFRKSPEATLEQLVVASRKQHGDDYPMLNLAEPKNSLILLKPTARLPARVSKGVFKEPSASGVVSHMGGIKMHVNDPSYKAIYAWISDYANSADGKYQSVEDLPQDDWYPSQHVVRVKGIPADWDTLGVVQIFAYPRTADGNSWQEQPVAFTQSLVTPRKIVNGSLFVLGDSSRPDVNASASWNAGEATLANGNYLIRAFYDRSKVIAETPTAMLNLPAYSEDCAIAEATVTAEWKSGFKNALVIEGSELTFK